MLPLSMLLVQLITVGVLLLSKLALNDGMSPFVIIGNVEKGELVCCGLDFCKCCIWRCSSNGVVLLWAAYYQRHILFHLHELDPHCHLLDGHSAKGWEAGIGKLVWQADAVGCVVVRRRHYGGEPSESCLSYAIYFIVQARLVKVFPSTYLMTVLTSLLGSLQAFVVGVFLVHDRSEWRLKWDLQLLTVIYSGVFNTGLAFLLITWVIRRSGPIYPSMFNSLSLILTMVLDSLLLGTNIYLGSILGTVLVVLGLYAFLWGKGKELKLAATVAAQKEQQGGVILNTQKIQGYAELHNCGLAHLKSSALSSSSSSAVGEIQTVYKLNPTSRLLVQDDNSSALLLLFARPDTTVSTFFNLDAVLDLEQVISKAPTSQLVKYIVGDMFEFIPTADAILLKAVLNSWDDDSCIKILQQCKRAIPTRQAGGKILILNVVIGHGTPDNTTKEAQVLTDMYMMRGSGFEREEKEWESVFLRAGLSDYNIMPIIGPVSIIEVLP
uniref:O-methyltransferase domain-containing protein n=1 Tax=Oryza glumipatula TaxID=40148 RepID=A0A0E0ANF0_9ORYZ